MNRKSESLKRFSGNASDFHNWSKHMADHMGKVHGEWKRVLEWISKNVAYRTFHMATLATEFLGPYQENAGELAAKLEQTLVD